MNRNHFDNVASKDRSIVDNKSDDTELSIFLDAVLDNRFSDNEPDDYDPDDPNDLGFNL